MLSPNETRRISRCARIAAPHETEKTYQACAKDFIGISVDIKVAVGTGGDGTSTKATGMNVQR